MNKTKLFIGMASFALAIGGVLVSKANKKFDPVTSGVFLNGAAITNLPSGFTTASQSGRTVLMVTAGALHKISTLLTNGAGSSKIYYRP